MNCLLGPTHSGENTKTNDLSRDAVSGGETDHIWCVRGGQVRVLNVVRASVTNLSNLPINFNLLEND